MVENAKFYAFCVVMTDVSLTNGLPFIMLKEMTQVCMKGVIPWRSAVFFQDVSDDMAICVIDLFPLFSP